MELEGRELQESLFSEVPVSGKLPVSRIDSGRIS